MWPPVNYEYLLDASIVHGDVTGQPSCVVDALVPRRAVTPVWRGRHDFEALCAPQPPRRTQSLPGIPTILGHHDQSFTTQPSVGQVKDEVTCGMESSPRRSSSRKSGARYIASGWAESLAGCKQP